MGAIEDMVEARDDDDDHFLRGLIKFSRPIHNGHFELKMVRKKPKNQLFYIHISTMVTSEVLLGCLVSTFKTVNYVKNW